jgi:hypothetical protein
LAVSVVLVAALVANGSFVSAATSFSQHDASRRCRWDVAPQRFGDLNGVSAISRRNVWVVGDRPDKRALAQPLAVHWLGGEWRPVDVPVKNGPNVLSAVAFATANDGWAVGRGLPSDAIERWNGLSWSVVPGADLGDRGADFNDVAVLGKNDVWAVGMSTPRLTLGADRRLSSTGTAFAGRLCRHPTSVRVGWWRWPRFPGTTFGLSESRSTTH